MVLPTELKDIIYIRWRALMVRESLEQLRRRYRATDAEAISWEYARDCVARGQAPGDTLVSDLVALMESRGDYRAHAVTSPYKRATLRVYVTALYARMIELDRLTKLMDL